MLALVALAFIAIPIVEIAVLIKVGGAIGAWNTIALVILTAIAGTALLRAQGLATLARVRDSLDGGVFPADALFDAACLLVAGVLLLTPGFVTDALGLALFLPPFRAALRRLIWRRLAACGGARVWVNGEEVGPRSPDTNGPASNGHAVKSEPGPTIEGEWREVEPPRDSRWGRGDKDDRNGENGGGR